MRFARITGIVLLATSMIFLYNFYVIAIDPFFSFFMQSVIRFSLPQSILAIVLIAHPRDKYKILFPWLIAFSIFIVFHQISICVYMEPDGIAASVGLILIDTMVVWIGYPLWAITLILHLTDVSRRRPT